MDAQAIATVGAVVMTATQITKWALPGNWDGWGVQIAGLLSVLGVVVWVISQPQFPPVRESAFGLLAGWITVYATAVGLYKGARMITAVPDDDDGPPAFLDSSAGRG